MISKMILYLKTGVDTCFFEKGTDVYLKYTPSNAEPFEYKIKDLLELFEGQGIFKFDSDEEIDHYFVLLESIESAIYTYYTNHDDLKDKNVIFILERLLQKIDIKLNSELLKSIQNNVRLCLSFKIYSEQEVKGAIKRIIKSVKDHHSIDGSTGYLDFLKCRFDYH